MWWRCLRARPIDTAIECRPPRLAPSIHPKGLTDAEIDVLVAFTENALHIRNLQYYEPEILPSE